MAIGLIKDCLSGLPGLASSDGHIHAPEIRTFGDLTDLPVVLQALESPFIRAVVAANVGGGLCVYKRDDGMYGCTFHAYKKSISDIIAADTSVVEHWLNQFVPEMFVEKAPPAGWVWPEGTGPDDVKLH